MTNEEFIESIRLAGEEWRPVRDFERYMVSNKGRILALSAPYLCGNRMCYREPKLLNPRIISKKSRPPHYLTVVLSDGNRHHKSFPVHRLVAFAFIPNPNNLPFINHKDENSQNNSCENLEWCTQQYNCNYGTHNARMAKTLHETAYQRKAVVQLSKDGKYISKFNSIRECAKSLNIHETAIGMCCKGKRNHAGGYKWMYLSDYEPLVNQ